MSTKSKHDDESDDELEVVADSQAKAAKEDGQPEVQYDSRGGVVQFPELNNQHRND